MSYTIKDFHDLLSGHPASSHPFFDFLDKKAQKGLSAKEYQVFAVNYIARTVFTIPEVAAAVYRASTDLRMKGVTQGAKTLGEEAGEHGPEDNHAVLLVKAINHHGNAVYGNSYAPVDHERIMGLFHLMQDSANVSSIERLEAAFDKSKFVSRALSEKKNNIRHGSNLLQNDFSELVQQAFGSEVGGNEKNENYLTSVKAGLELMSMGINKEVVSYGIQQLQIMDSEEKCKLAGCAYAHEGLADNMMLHVFKLLYPQAKNYPGGEHEFDKEVYPYFAAHGDYKSMANGQIGVNAGEGVEAEHARREIAKIQEVIDSGKEFAENAYNGAKEFADRQNNVWHGIMQSMSATVAKGI